MHSQQQLPRSTYYLLLGQAFNLISAVLAVTVAAIVGMQLAPSYSLATIPYGLQFLAMLLCTYVFSLGMQRYGRYVVFQAGALFLMLSGALGYLAIAQHSFMLLCVSHFLLGMFLAAANFYRFAATDKLHSKELIAKASSLVISGGVLAALVAPVLAIHLQQVAGYPAYALCYAFYVPLGVLVLLVNWLWQRSNDKLEQGQASQTVTTQPPPAASSGAVQLSSPVLIAMLSCSTGYFVMALMMIQASMTLKHQHSFGDASHAIQMHVLAMFIPSFFAAALMGKFGIQRYILLGFALMATASGLAIYSQTLLGTSLSLIILGLGWNFSFTGGSALLASASGANRFKLQGMNDTAVALFATLGAFLPAPLLSHLGWAYSNVLLIVICVLAMGLMLALRRKGGAVLAG